MKGIAGYAKPNADGGVTIDVEGMLVDAITMLKADGYTEQMAKELFAQIWRDCQVGVTVPDKSKN